MAFFYLKALHIIFVITWFAGLFYIVRLFVYFAETPHKTELEREVLQKQYLIMQKRLWYGITFPSCILTVILGLSLLTYYQEFPNWLLMKLGFVCFLLVYHFLCHKIFKQQQNGIIKYSSQQLRIWNEVATVLLVAIVFLVTVKSSLSIVYGLGGLILLSILLMASIKIYKQIREKK